MFKKKLRSADLLIGTRVRRSRGAEPIRRSALQYRRPRLNAASIISIVFLLTLTACRTIGPLPQVNLSEPGWTVLQGQASWRSKLDAPEISGELLLAQKSNGQTFVQFTKTPFPFVIAQSTTNAWQMEIPVEDKSYRAPGQPPARVIWFQLPRAVSGAPLAKNWSWRDSTNGWRLENISTGELLEGYFENRRHD